MIPKYYRCGDPSRKCPLSVTKEILKEDKKWTCPCANPNCVDFREPVSFVKGITGGRSWIVYGGGIAAALLLLLLFLFGGNDSCGPKLRDFQARLASIEKDLAALEGKPKTGSNPAAQSNSAVVTLESDAKSLEARAAQALSAADESNISQLLNEVSQRSEVAKRLGESVDKPESGSGVDVAEAKGIIAKLLPLEGEVDEQVELAQTQCAKHVGQFEDLRANLEASLSKARRIAASVKNSGPADDALKVSIRASISKLAAIHSRLGAFSPPPKAPDEPFLRSEADLLIAAVPDVAQRLVAPLAAAWSGSKSIPGANGVIFIDGGPTKRLVVEPCGVEQGFEKLAAGEIALFFADRAPTSAELGRFGADFKESRSVAEVVAMDALTLLVHPDNPVDTFEVGQPVSLKVAVGADDSAVGIRARRFGWRQADVADASGEQAAMASPNTLGLSVYHAEGQNLRAKRLAVKASRNASPLKPSPFSIATEEYLYSYRIVAWTPKRPADGALAMVKFITSNPGQAIVDQCGFVDLRLKPSKEKVDPRIMAALGRALGVDKISDAQRLSTNIHFAVGDFELDLKAEADVERIPREVASNYPTHQIVILGFTDSDGGPQINQPLSVKRAEKVAAGLRVSKVDARSGGLGDSFPIDTNETDSGKARNRRAEVWVAKP